MYNLIDKVAIVTGGNKGIGKEISIELASCGANIAIVYGNDQVSSEETANEIISMGRKCSIYKCNVSDFNGTKDIVKDIIQDFGSVDILVNNAGITKDKLILNMTEQEYDDVLDINLKGAFNMIRHLYSNFIKKRCGKIINITSISGLDGNAGQANYSSSKAGLVGLTKSVAKELAGKKVNCNAIAPGLVETAMTDKMNSEMIAKITERIPLKRIANAKEIAYLVSFLASDKSDYITGQVIRIDGGLTI